MSLRKVFRHVAKSIHYAEARDRASRARTEEALGFIKRILRSYGEQIPSPRTPIFANVYYANLCARTGDKRATYEACVVAVHQLRTMSTTKKEHEVVRNYLLYACKYFLAGSTETADSDAFKLAASIPLTYPDIDLPPATGMLASVLNATPEWCAEFDGWFLEKLSLSRAANLP